MRLPIKLETNLRDLGLLALRVSVGLLMLIGHGLGKMGKLGDDPVQFADPLGMGVMTSLVLAVFAEVFCSAALVVGLLTRAAAVPLIVTMLVAAFIVHADDPWSRKEFAIMYLIPYVTLLLTGPGKFSLDAKLFRRK